MPLHPTISHLVSGLRPDEVCFLSGAGISMAPPTSLPGGVALTERLIRWAFADDPLDVLCGVDGSGENRGDGLYQRLQIENRPAPRLEVVLGVASEPDLYGARAFDFALGPMFGATPNPVHAFLHAHLAAGGRHLTANFDTCIERAGVHDVGRQILHFHGAIRDDPMTLGATFRNIERGFAPKLASEIIWHLSMPLIVIVGYSGSDVFDVAPMLAQLAEEGGRPLKETTVVWVAYADGDLAPAEAPVPLVPPGESSVLSDFLAEERVPWVTRQLESMRLAGATVHYLTGGPKTLYEHFAAAWQLSMTPAAPDPGELAPDLHAAPTGDERLRAAVRLWQTMGLTHRATELMDANQALFTEREMIETKAAALWLDGKYRAASRQWRRRPRRTPVDRAAWDERQIACRWAAGRYISAVVRAQLALRRAERAGVVSSELSEVYARTVQHMLRTPDLRLFARWLTPIVRRELDRNTPGPDAGEHMRIRFESARRAIAGDTARAETMTSARSRFTEAESLVGVVNFRHGRLRRLFEEGRPVGSLITEQTSWAELIHAGGDARRSAFLPGAERHIGMKWRLRAVFGNQYGNWHRCRLLGKIALDAVRSCVRRGSSGQ